MTFKPAPDEAPKRARPAAPKRPSTRSLRKEIDGFVVFINGIVAIIAPQDALDPIEVGALVHALDEEAKSNARFRRGLEALLKVTGGGSLWMVVSVIAARRLARHGVMGPQVGPVVDDGGAFILSTINAQPSEAAESMQTIIDMFKGVQHESEQSAPDTTAGNGAAA